MNSIKNAIVTITLLVVGYGSYVILQEPAHGPFVDQRIGDPELATVGMPQQSVQGFAQQPTLAPQYSQPLAGNRFAAPQAKAQSILQTPQFDNASNATSSVQPATELKAKAEALADAVASRFDSFSQKPIPNNTENASRFSAPRLSNPENVSGADLSLPLVELEEAAAGVASAFKKAKDSVAEQVTQQAKQVTQQAKQVTQQVEQTFGGNVNQTVDKAINQAQNAFTNQFENAKAKANDFAQQAKDFGTATRKELESKLPPLPKLVDAPSELKLPELKTDLVKSTAAEAEQESLQLDTKKTSFRKLQPKEVAPEKTANELTISNIASTIPPPFANRLEGASPFDKSVQADNSQDRMPVLPRVDEWEPYVGPPLSAADLEAGRAPEALDVNAQAANTLKVVEPGLVLPADTTIPASGDKLEPFAEPINPPVATNGGTESFTNSTASPITFEQPPQYPNTADLNQTQPVSFNKQEVAAPGLIQNQAKSTVKPNATFEKIWIDVQGHLKKRDYPRALRTLTPWSSESDLNKEQAERCIRLLDQLAGAIIYSRQSYLEPEYQVKAGETLEEIAAQYGVPQDLVAKINGVAPPYALMTGEELKVVRGPFRATVSLSRKELTLYVGPNYAGRFPVKIGSDLPPESAFYEVAEKLEGRTYFDRKLGREIIRSEAINRYGKHWLGLRGEHITTGHSVGIHGRPTKDAGDDVGSLSLEAKDAADVFSILGIGSRVEVRP